MLVLLAWPLGPTNPREARVVQRLQATLSSLPSRAKTPDAARASPPPAARPEAPSAETPPSLDAPPKAPTGELPDTAPAPAPAYFPFSALSRPPELLTEISPDSWPSTPGAPPGQVTIEVDIGTDGRVMRVNPLCEPQLCEAGGIYGGFIMGWRFRPAEIEGKAVPSRIHIEVEIGDTQANGIQAIPIPQPSAPQLQAAPRQ